MRSKYDYKIIINKGKTKPKLFLFLSLNETLIVLAVAGIVYKLFGLFASELVAIIIGVGTGIAIASLFIEIPTSHLNVIGHIKLAYRYYFIQPHRFYFFREKNTIDKEDNTADAKEFKVKEQRYKAKRKKTSKKNKFKK